MKQLSESEMLHRAAAYCSAGERCIQDMEKKIKAAGLTEEESDRIIARLLEERFIDESRFARYFVNDKLRFNKWGRVKINYEMQRKGIPSGIRSEALAGIDEQEYCSILLSLLKSKKKATRGKNDREIYAKLLRFAFGRGFETKETSGCLKQLFDGNDFEDDFEDDFFEDEEEDASEKKEEKKDRKSAMDGISKSQSALMSAQKISKRAVKTGFEWPNEKSLYECVFSEIKEFQDAKGDKDHMEDELGDILFAVVNLARWNKIDAEQALLRANKKFMTRFRKMEELAVKPLEQYSFEEFDTLWKQAKKEC